MAVTFLKHLIDQVRALTVVQVKYFCPNLPKKTPLCNPFTPRTIDVLCASKYGSHSYTKVLLFRLQKRFHNGDPSSLVQLPLCSSFSKRLPRKHILKYSNDESLILSIINDITSNSTAYLIDCFPTKWFYNSIDLNTIASLYPNEMFIDNTSS